MKEWRQHIDRINESAGFKKRIRSYIKDRNSMLKKGGQKNTPPFTKEMGTHVTFDKQLEEEVEPESFDTKRQLEPAIWQNEKLKPRIRKNLLKIAQDFIDGLPAEINVEDVTVTGSIANYNWSNYSDVDLHIIVDFLGVDENRALVKSFFDNARMRWNDKHHISVKGYDVEVYIEDSAETHQSSGIYSLLKNDWIKKPSRTDIKIDFPAARRKADDLEFQVNIASNLIRARKYEAALRNIERLKKKIKNMRRAGLESSLREFSVENIAFKILRRNGILGYLSSLKTEAYDEMMNVNGGPT
jgi:predicted nucleotidyltransferase